MASIKYSSIISDISGSVGNVTFQRSRYSSIIRNKPSPGSQQTTRRLNSRIFFNQLLIAFQSLTQQQLAILKYCTTYNPIFTKKNKNSLLSPRSLFFKYNLIRLHAGLSIISDFNYNSLVQYPLSFNLFIEDDYLFLNFTDIPLVTDQLFFLLKLSKPHTSSNYFNVSQNKVIKAVFVDASTYDLTSSYNSVFFNLPAPGSFISYEIIFFHLNSIIFSMPLCNIINVT
jgi:hypothetical protein